MAVLVGAICMFMHGPRGMRQSAPSAYQVAFVPLLPCKQSYIKHSITRTLSDALGKGAQSIYNQSFLYRLPSVLVVYSVGAVAGARKAAEAGPAAGWPD